MSDLGVFKSSEFKQGDDELSQCLADVDEWLAGLPGRDDMSFRLTLSAYDSKASAGVSVPGSIEALTVSSDDALDRQVGGDHYKSAPIQPVEFCERNGLSGLESAVVKRIWRHRRGGKGLQDLQKAAHEIELLIQFHYSE